MVHRDLKPANLMVGRHNEVYVMDWGICRLMAQPAEPAPAPTPAGGTTGAPSAARTGSISRAEVSPEASHDETAYGAIVGTPLYMSPEQAHGRHDQLDAKSDQCALGLILFELVALKRPIGGKTLAEVLTQASSGTREPLVHAYGEAIPGELGAIVTKASSPAPADRYASVAALADDLRRFLRGDAVLARPDSAWQRAVRSLGRHRQAAAITLLALVIAILAGGAALLYRQESALKAQERRERAIERLVMDVSEQGDRLQVSLLALHDALDMAVAVGRPRLRVRPADHGADPLGRRLARCDHRLRHRARHPSHRRRGRGATRRHRPGFGDARPRGGPRPPRTRQRRGARARGGRRRRHRPARAPRRVRERPEVHRAGGGARAHGARRPSVRLVQGGQRRP